MFRKMVTMEIGTLLELKAKLKYIRISGIVSGTTSSITSIGSK